MGAGFDPRQSSIQCGDNLDLMRSMPDGAFRLIYVDPPFNTGRPRERRTLATTADCGGDRTGFGGRRYRHDRARRGSPTPTPIDDYPAFLEPRLREVHRLLDPTGTLYLHLDYREAHYVQGPAGRASSAGRRS